MGPAPPAGDVVTMAAPPVQLFVFDLAGTTVVDDGQVLDAFVATADLHGLRADPNVLKARMGWHKQHVFATLLREAGADTAPAEAMARHFEQEFAAAVARRPLRPTPGALATLRKLDLEGVHIAFNTGFARATADLVLQTMGWADFPSVASDEVPRGRPAPDLIRRAMELVGVLDPRHVGVAGDTPADLQAGTAAACAMVVGVGCGSHRLDELAPHPHTLLLPDLTTLPAVVLHHD
jgi:phosphonatase-like hydrolase